MSTEPWESGWFNIDEDTPDSECGFTTSYPDGIPSLGENFQCNRSTWNGTGRCIWHAEVDGKSVDALQSARLDEPEFLDGAYLDGVNAGDSISFAECKLVGARLSGIDLRRADLAEANLRGADLTNARLTGADLSDTQLFRATLKNADLQSANLTDSYLEENDATEASFSSTNLTNATLNRVNLANGILFNANLKSADLTRSNLSNVPLCGSELSKANLLEVNLTGADLSSWIGREKTNLAEANLREAVLSDVDFEGASLIKANLERARITRTDFFDADLTGTRLYGAIFDSPQVNSRTNFGNHYADVLSENKEHENDTESDETHPRLKAIWTNRQVEQIAQQNALRDVARDAYIERKNLRRDQYREEGRWLKYLWASLSGALTGHAEDPWRVVYTSIGVILLSGFIYPFIGGMEKVNGPTTPFTFDVLPQLPISIPDPLTTLLMNQYFSAVTFTTLGYGDIQPATGAAQLLASVESFVGALLMALLVFVLGRRTTW